jgi:hypothetical protein
MVCQKLCQNSVGGDHSRKVMRSFICCWKQKISENNHKQPKKNCELPKIDRVQSWVIESIKLIQNIPKLDFILQTSKIWRIWGWNHMKPFLTFPPGKWTWWSTWSIFGDASLKSTNRRCLLQATATRDGYSFHVYGEWWIPSYFPC